MIDDLLARNRAWSVNRSEADPDFFPRLARQQRPDYLWVGCADSRVPANDIVGLDPGELFVHRNVANLAPPSDINFLSVLAFAVNALEVKHVIVCGHYGCGGIKAAFRDERNGIVDHWLEPVRASYRRHRRQIDAIGGEAYRIDALCEFNVQRPGPGRRHHDHRPRRLEEGPEARDPRLDLRARRRLAARSRGHGHGSRRRRLERFQPERAALAEAVTGARGLAGLRSSSAKAGGDCSRPR